VKLQDRFSKIIETLIKRQYILKLLGLKKRISFQNFPYFFEKKLGLSFIKPNILIAKAKKINNNYKQICFRVKNNKRIQEIQRKYPNLKIIETYCYLMIEHNFRLKKEHLDIFETGLIILLSKIIEKKR